MNNKITVHLDIHFEEIENLIRDQYRNTIIKYRNGDRLTFRGEDAKKIYKKLARNFEGEHMD